MNKNGQKIIWGVVVVVFVGLIWWGASRKQPTPGPTTLPTREPTKIGGVFVLSGPVASAGIRTPRGAQLALDEINASGGINGHPLELVQEDSQYDPKQAVSAYQALKFKGIRYYILDGSPVAAALGQMIVQDGNFSIIPAATTPVYKDGNPLTCRIALTADVFAPPIVETPLKKLNFKALSFLVMDNEYGRGMEQEITKTLETLGGKAVTSEYFQGSDADLRTQITKLKARQSQTDALFVINISTPQVMFEQLKQLQWQKPIVSDLWTIRSPQLKDLSLAEGVLLADYDYVAEDDQNDSPRAKSFKQRYRSTFNDEPVYLAAAAYDITHLVAQTIKVVGDENPAKVGEYIANLKNYQGITGTLSFNPDCEVTRNVVFRKVEGGKIVNL